MIRFNRHIIIFTFLSVSLAFGQTKNEKEERILFNEFPEKARPYFGSEFPKVKSLKFYKETDGEKASFEAKFKFKKRYFSLEFDTSGKLEDIEVITKTKHIEASVLNHISKYFDEYYDKVRFIKIQKQYKNDSTGNDGNFIRRVLRNNIKNSGFEIIAETSKSGSQTLSEFTFNPDGQFVASRAILPSSYEYVLY